MQRQSGAVLAVFGIDVDVEEQAARVFWRFDLADWGALRRSFLDKDFTWIDSAAPDSAAARLT